ncbi:hypothetical protein, partial [Nocardia carnea]|uniref:hypothetical protein n=1 Tax=Nocardia carnea TaxID=37328 RepID=UPI0024574FB5
THIVVLDSVVRGKVIEAIKSFVVPRGAAGRSGARVGLGRGGLPPPSPPRRPGLARYAVHTPGVDHFAGANS